MRPLFDPSSFFLWMQGQQHFVDSSPAVYVNDFRSFVHFFNTSIKPTFKLAHEYQILIFYKNVFHLIVQMLLSKI